MEGLRLIVGVVLPYIAFAVFIGGMIYRIRSWQKLPSPAMTLFPAPATGKENLLNTIKEALLFKSLFSGDRVLWTMAWFFHVVLALVFLGHFRVFFNVDKLLCCSGGSSSLALARSPAPATTSRCSWSA
jgi:nitrate reductase gamma subunit